MKQTDLHQLEQDKISEIEREFKLLGKKLPSYDDLEGELNFDEFQQKTGKMLYEKDEILIEQWMQEEKEKRLKEK